MHYPTCSVHPVVEKFEKCTSALFEIGVQICQVILCIRIPLTHTEPRPIIMVTSTTVQRTATYNIGQS